MSSSPTASHRAGYIVAIVFLIIFMIFINNLREWNLPFVNTYVTSAYTSWLWAGNLSLSVAIFCNILFLADDPRWFRRLMESHPGRLFPFFNRRLLQYLSSPSSLAND